MNVSVFGLGFVGTVTAGCLAENGHNVVGVDIDSRKVEAILHGESPIMEPGVSELIGHNVRARRLRATADVEAAVLASDISLVCVNVPTAPNGSQEIAGLERLARELGAAIASKQSFHSVVIRSTVLPATTRQRVQPILEESTRSRIGNLFGLAHNPEFVRQGSALSDFRNAPRCVIGELDRKTADRLAEIFAAFSGAIYRVSPELSEAVKYADNAWHALKVAFANEIGAVCQSSGVDSHALMDIFCADEVLNLSRAYLRPGFPFGGTCLLKDISAFSRWSVQTGLDIPLLSQIGPSNDLHLQRCVDWLTSHGRQRFALLGLAYKPGTGELRSSPFIRIAERLLAAGRDVRAFDPEVFSSLRAAGPHRYEPDVAKKLHALLVEQAQDIMAWSDTIVVCSPAPEYRRLLSQVGNDHVVLDFGRGAAGSIPHAAYA